jgi:integrase
MGQAVDEDLTDNLKFKHRKFSYNEEPTEEIYLTEHELNKLYRFDLSSNKRLEQVRDLFIFGAWVGLRISDYSNIKPDNIKQVDGEYFIDITTQKTKDRVIIPCNPIVLEIFNKYEHKANKLPDTISDQRFNLYIKEACQLAGLDEKGRIPSSPDLMLWQEVSSHSARRSFCTNYYLQGFPVIDLMRISTHKTERSFLKYIRLSPQDVANRMAAHNKKNWSAMMLKVA